MKRKTATSSESSERARVRRALMTEVLRMTPEHRAVAAVVRCRAAEETERATWVAWLKARERAWAAERARAWAVSLAAWVRATRADTDAEEAEEFADAIDEMARDAELAVVVSDGWSSTVKVVSEGGAK